MASENFLLVSLEEAKAKELAQIVSNDICRKILDFLTGKEKGASETEISKDMQIPLSTVHYNLKQLLKSGIVKAEEFHYSPKGKEVLHYSLANKYIIIAPKATATESLANKLRKILPVALVVAAAGAVLQAIDSLRKSGVNVISHASYSIQKSAEAYTPMTPEAAGKVSSYAADKLNASIMPDANTIQATSSHPSIALWFIAGAAFAIAALLIYESIRNSKR